MPKSSQQIIDHDDTLADVFQNYEPQQEHERDVRPFHALLKAVEARGASERAIVAAVQGMRDARWSWNSIGALLGTTGQAAQQRYGRE